MGRIVIKGMLPFNDDDHKGLSLISVSALLQYRYATKERVKDDRCYGIR